MGGANGALRCKAAGKSRTILFNLYGHGHFDLSAYSAFFADKLVDQEYDEATLAMSLAGLPSVLAQRRPSEPEAAGCHPCSETGPAGPVVVLENALCG